MEKLLPVEKLAIKRRIKNCQEIVFYSFETALLLPKENQDHVQVHNLIFLLQVHFYTVVRIIKLQFGL